MSGTTWQEEIDRLRSRVEELEDENESLWANEADGKAALGRVEELETALRNIGHGIPNVGLDCLECGIAQGTARAALAADTPPTKTCIGCGQPWPSDTTIRRCPKADDGFHHFADTPPRAELQPNPPDTWVGAVEASAAQPTKSDRGNRPLGDVAMTPIPPEDRCPLRGCTRRTWPHCPDPWHAQPTESEKYGSEHDST